MKKLLKATHNGVIDINGIKINCAVLEDETRVISEKSVAKALGSYGSGSYWLKRKEKGAVLPRYLYARFLEKFIPEKLLLILSDSISYESVSNKISTGIRAEALPEICDVWIQAAEKGAIPETKRNIAQNAYTLLKGFATIGIIALVDEATGFQVDRQRDALQKILTKYLRSEYAAWAKCFPLEFYEELFRLKGWFLDKRTMKMPSVVGKYTNDIVYDRLAPGILEELRKRNPILPTGRRKTKHHQWLTEETGHPALDKHFSGVMALMRANTEWDKFKRGLERAYPKIGSQLALKLFEDDES